VSNDTIYLRNKDFDRAITEFSEAIRLDPNYAWAYEWRSFAYAYRASSNRSSDAAADQRRAREDKASAIRLDPALARRTWPPMGAD
jgi:tetratricopeptide (TPR) repeat protein